MSAYSQCWCRPVGLLNLHFARLPYTSGYKHPLVAYYNNNDWSPVHKKYIGLGLPTSFVAAKIVGCERHSTQNQTLARCQ